MTKEAENELAITVTCAVPAGAAGRLKPHQVGSALLRFFELMGRCGVGGVQINLSVLGGVLERCDRKIWSDLAVASIATGSKTESVHLLPFGDFDYQLGSEPDQLLLLRIARILGAKKLIVHPGGPVHWGPRCLERDVQSVSALAALASRLDATVLLENTPSSSALYVEEIIRMLCAPNVRMQFDVGHYMIKNGDSLESMLRRFADILGGVELNDNDAVHDLHGLPGTGVVPWKKLFEALAAVDYKGSLVLESEFDITTKRGLKKTERQITATREFVREEMFAATSSPA